MRIIGLPRQVAIYEAMRTLFGLVVLEIILFLGRHFVHLAVLDNVLVGLQILVLFVSVVEILLAYYRLIRYTEIVVTDNALKIKSGRWFSTVSFTRLPLVISVEVARGPVLKALGLGLVSIRSVGPAPSIPPLPIVQAEELQSLVTTEASVS